MHQGLINISVVFVVRLIHLSGQYLIDTIKQMISVLLTNRISMILILIISFPSFVIAHIGYSTQSYCLDQIPSSTLSLKCPVNQLIKLGRIIYGYSWSNDCSYIDKDCTMDIPREDILCLTTNNCTVRVVEHPLILQDCWNLAATYVQAEYECLTDYSIQNICQPQDIHSSHGFLSTPNYPNGFLSNLNCPCALVASPGHSIILEIIDFHLPTCTEAGLILWLGQDFQTKCLRQDPVTLISNFQQNITLRFYTLKNNKQGGILMKYSVSPESDNATVRLQCYSPSTIHRLTTSNSFVHTRSSSPVPNVFDQADLNDLPKQLRPNANQSIAYSRKQLATNSSRSNMGLTIILIIIIVIFLIIINILVWMMCSLRSKSSRPPSSVENLCSHQVYSSNEFKPTHRLKTLHSLLYAHPKGNDTEPITTNPIRHFDSVLSEGHPPSNSSSTRLNHGFITKSKSNPKLHEPRQINSWDDI